MYLYVHSVQPIHTFVLFIYIYIYIILSASHRMHSPIADMKSNQIKPK